MNIVMGIWRNILLGPLLVGCQECGLSMEEVTTCGHIERNKFYPLFTECDRHLHLPPSFVDIH